MHCKNCGKELGKDALICPNCSTLVSTGFLTTHMRATEVLDIENPDMAYLQVKELVGRAS